MKKLYEEKEKQMRREFKESNPSDRAKALETLYNEKEKAFSSLRKNHDNDKTYSIDGGNTVQKYNFTPNFQPDPMDDAISRIEKRITENHLNEQ